jgi:hypothetical protein
MATYLQGFNLPAEEDCAVAVAALQSDWERMFATPASQAGDTPLETLLDRTDNVPSGVLTSSALSGTHSSGLLQLLKALQDAMRFATFEDIVLDTPGLFLERRYTSYSSPNSSRLLRQVPAGIVPPHCTEL